MNKTHALLAIALLAFSVVLAEPCFAEAPPQPPSGSLALTLYAKTLRESQPIAGRAALYSLRSVETGRETVFSGLTAADGSLTAYVDSGQWFVHAEIDLPETRGADYAAALTVNVSRDANQTIYFQRVSSASGAVSFQDNETAANALVEVNCLQDFYELKELNAETSAAPRFETANAFRADASGSFLLKFVPVGACTFTATADAAAGGANESASALVEVKEGELAEVSLKLKRKAQPSVSSQLVWLALLALALLVVAGFGREYLKKNKERIEAAKPAKEKEKEKKEKEKLEEPTSQASEEKEKQGEKQGKLAATKKMRDVMNALSERERAVVEVLIAHDGALKQNKIYRETLIPKTSLARALDSLARRNVVRLTPEGNSQLVELTDWFKSK